MNGRLLFFIPILIVYPYQTPAEGKHLAKGDEDAMVNLAHWRAAEARDEQCAPEGAQCYGGSELDGFHYPSYAAISMLNTY